MTTGLATIPSYFRGQTLQFQTTFLDFNGNVVQPPAATLVVWYESVTAGPDQELTIPMTGPVMPSVFWTALLDTRGFQASRQVQWSIHSNASLGTPVGTQDGAFMLTANQANQPTF